MKRILYVILSVAVLFSCNKAMEEKVQTAYEIILSESKITLDEGESQTLTASVYPTSISQNVVWSVLDEEVATVVDGVVTGVKAGITYVVATSEDGAVLASCLIDVKGEHSYEPVPDGSIMYLTEPEDLVALSQRDTYIQAFLMNDIDMTGVEYNSDEFNFEGLFDGNNHSITGLTTPLFNNLKGAVRNLTLDSEINYEQAGEGGQNSVNNPYGIGVLAHYAYLPEDVNQVLPSVENVTVKGLLTVNVKTTLDNYNIGGLLGASNGIPLKDCVNNAKITLGDDFSAKTVRLGGVVGIAQSAVTANLNGCVNAGEISLDAKSISGDIMAAGVVGAVSQAVTIKDCENSGDITLEGKVTNAYLAGVAALLSANVDLSLSSNSGEISLENCYIGKQFYVGGILGNITNKTENTYSSLTNTGDILIDQLTTASGNDVFAYVGGIVACSDGTGKTFKDCVNKADINARQDDATTTPFKCRIGGIAGIINRNPEGSSSECNIRFKGTVPGCHIGGVAGYLNIAEYKNISYKGTIWTNGTAGTNYTGGLVGNVNSTTDDGFKVFSGCRLSGSVHGANSSTGVAGLFCNSQAEVSYSIVDCVVESGSIRKMSNDSSNDNEITSEDHLTGDVLIGGKGYKEFKKQNCTVVKTENDLE